VPLQPGSGEGRELARPLLRLGSMNEITDKTIDETQRRLSAIRPRLHRCAMALWKSDRGLIDQDEALALADMAALEAWRRKRIAEEEGFARYASVHVRGRIRAHIRHERHQRSIRREVSLANQELDPVHVETRMVARVRVSKILAKLTPIQRQVVTRYLCAGESLSALSRRRNKHPSWGSRTLAAARRRLDVHLRGSPSPRG
jgi:RNA polymerase sigma factor (sigma-70 family)